MDVIPAEQLIGMPLHTITKVLGEEGLRDRFALEIGRFGPSERLRLAAALGPGTLLAYLCGGLTLEAGLGRLSRRVGAQLGAVLLDDPRAAVDVDSVADFELVERLLTGTG